MNWKKLFALIVLAGNLCAINWSQPLDVSIWHDGIGSSPQVLIDRHGDGYASWKRFVNSSYRMEGSTFFWPYSTWCSPSTIAENPAGLTLSSLNVMGNDGENHKIAVWMEILNGSPFARANYYQVWNIWSSPVSISSASATAISQVQVVSNFSGSGVDGETYGNSAAVWVRTDGGSTVIQGNYYLTATFTWSTPFNISATNTNATNPSITISNDNRVVVVWQESNGSNTVIRKRGFTLGGALSSTVTLSAVGADASLPQIVSDGAGYAAIAWTRFDGANTVVQACTCSSDGSLSSVSNISSSGQDATLGQLAMNSLQRAVGIWRLSSGAIQSAALFGGTWSAPITAAASSTTNTSPRVGIDSAGNAVAAWSGTTGSYEILYSALQAVGASGWSPVQTVSNVNAVAREYQLAVSPSGKIILIWATVVSDTSSIIQSAVAPSTSLPD